MLRCSPSQHQQNVKVHRDPLLKEVILLVILVSSITKNSMVEHRNDMK